MTEQAQAPDTLTRMEWANPRFKYVRVNLITGEKTVDVQSFAARSLFLAEMAKWNRLGMLSAMQWAYYEFVE